MPLQDDLDPTKPPPFMKLKPGADNTAEAESWDAWSVERSGDHKTDYLKGVEYADIAIRKVIATDNPSAVTMPVMEMVGKIGRGEDIGDGAIEKGFLDRLVSLATERRQHLDSN